MKYPLLCICCLYAGLCMAQQDIVPDSTTQIIFNRIVDTGSTDKKVIQTQVETKFPGGDPAWAAYLKENLNSKIGVTNGAPKGTYRVIIKFIVAKDGSISEAVAETKNGYGMENEAIRVITNSAKWRPAMQNGKPVNAYRRQPISFMVN